MLRKTYPYYIANKPLEPNHELAVVDKFTGELATRVPLADAVAIDRAIARAVRAAEPMRRMATYERRQVLEHCVKSFSERAEELAFALCVEAGKPIKDARGEVIRLIDTFRVAAQATGQFVGEVIPLDITSRARGYTGMWKRVPVGACSFISPFNFPLNLAAHKIAPAIAVGCPFVLKPASKTPVGALLIGEVLAQTNLPEGAFSILPCHRDGADLFTTDERLKLLSFTGSPAVGWELKKKAGKKKVILELGGNAACIIDRDSNIDECVQRVIVGAFYQSGQSCIKAQRLMVHASIYSKFRDKLVEESKKLKTGDPKDESTFIGPLIDEVEAKRLEDWIRSAQKRGARILCGGNRKGPVLEATLLENVPIDEKICSEEAFGPVSVLSSFEDFDEALQQVNASRFGLQAGIFTRDIEKMLKAWDVLEVGGVVIGDIPSWRADNMPYGGVKDSGLGREGVRFAMEEMSEVRMLVIKA
ncbi:MAG: aldehyde dehydrogenase family protein [Deltaproteobacteria bacterium]|nr:aldehyde dehydrogenase family protein [Deltaproteobacteria bacterium]